MITERFNGRAIANMEVALERACLLLPTGSEKHRTRKLIANKIIECANRGDTTLSGLTEAGYAAVKQLTTLGRVCVVTTPRQGDRQPRFRGGGTKPTPSLNGQ